MSKMDICTCHIQLSGDKRTIVVRGPTRPMTWPEINLMMHIHGERYVTHIEVIDTVETDNAQELQNLRVTYGEVVNEAFPGSRPRLPLEAPDDTPRAVKPEPIDDEPDVVEAQGTIKRRKPAQKVA